MKNMGNIYTGDFVPPTRTGKKAVVEMEIKVLVEVFESDDWNDMANQAKDSLNKRIVEGKGFYPFSARPSTIHTNAEVDRMKQNIFVDGRSIW